jgi:hypothetical protein
MSIILGSIGLVCILSAFLLDEFSKKINQDTVHYNLLNIFGALLLFYYAYTLDSWPFMVLNAIWLIAAAVKLVRILNE